MSRSLSSLPAASARGALRTGAENLNSVSDVDESVACGHLGRPLLDGRTLYLHGPPAVPADQVVMVTFATAATVASFAVVAANDVELSGLCERPHLAVDRGEPDVLTANLEL